MGHQLHPWYKFYHVALIKSWCLSSIYLAGREVAEAPGQEVVHKDPVIRSPSSHAGGCLAVLSALGSLQPE